MASDCSRRSSSAPSTFHPQRRDPWLAEFVDAEGSAAIDLFLLIGFLVGLWAVPRFGRIHMQVVGFAGMTLGMLILAFAVLAGGGAAAHVPIVFAGFILFNLAMNAGPNATTFSLAPELFPTSVRASASGFAAATAKVGATLGIFVLPQVKEHWGVAAVLDHDGRGQRTRRRRHRGPGRARSTRFRRAAASTRQCHGNAR